jgi:glycosyltransferase involved in cell wall biosynthesis
MNSPTDGRESMTANTNLPMISIITTSYSMERLGDITELLDSIHAQAYKNIEVLVVTERSQELTNNIEAYIDQKGYSGMRVLYNQGEWGLSSARNLGIERASGEVIAFVDDDALLLPGWAEETAKTYAEDSPIIGLTGPILPLWERDSMAWFPREFYWIFSCTYWDWAEKTEVRNGYGTNISFRREAFDLCGLFETSLGVKGHGRGGWQGPGGEETEFSLRARQKTGKRIIYSPEVKVKHKVYGYRLSTKFIAKRAYWEGRAKAMFNKSYRSSDKAVLYTEHELLYRIFFKLIPNSLKLLFSQPIVALRQLWVTVTVLSCVAAGYIGYQVSTLSARF